ncbi:SubName: Full=Uncharacterized protein {ECO:0000313/EMBL:CCA72946.1} [Serendipita indica DSM 11827]|uniref:Uncharacterized protein n=1 Tax=Serendipita indica (strain DSM 11827) TaxID=1109443 RepID=G4TNQ3_SERID|nr:SubName: Full=Uncharacterized protein {ECO:0000313/EMBL:CCA72946.1} [Serendipita indica DSM 11827]CCA72946.1 hypothetical protein PIIN_06901 [Serendipita indica DSM 11827]
MKWSALALLGLGAFVHGQTAIQPCATAITNVYPYPCPLVLCVSPTPTTVTKTITSTHSVTLPTKCPPLTFYPLTETLKKREAEAAYSTAVIRP